MGLDSFMYGDFLKVKIIHQRQTHTRFERMCRAMAKIGGVTVPLRNSETFSALVKLSVCGSKTSINSLSGKQLIRIVFSPPNFKIDNDG
jgi:hypothetical protein